MTPQGFAPIMRRAPGNGLRETARVQPVAALPHETVASILDSVSSGAFQRGRVG